MFTVYVPNIHVGGIFTFATMNVVLFREELNVTEGKQNTSIGLSYQPYFILSSSVCDRRHSKVTLHTRTIEEGVFDKNGMTWREYCTQGNKKYGMGSNRAICIPPTSPCFLARRCRCVSQYAGRASFRVRTRPRLFYEVRRIIKYILTEIGAHFIATLSDT